MALPTDKGEFKAASRRELLKLLPLAALGAFAVPRFQEPLLKKGLAFLATGFRTSVSVRITLRPRLSE
jgi:hypothetical protein